MCGPTSGLRRELEVKDMNDRLNRLGEYFSYLNKQIDRVPKAVRLLWIAITLFLAILVFGIVTFTIPGLFSDSEIVSIFACIPGTLLAIGTLIASYVAFGRLANHIR